MAAWFAALDPASARVSAATFGELQAGVEKTRAHDPAKAAELEAWVDRLIRTADIAPVDEQVFRLWARLMVGQQPKLRLDAIIAATALCRGYTVATRNTRDFAGFGVPVFDPFA